MKKNTRKNPVTSPEKQVLEAIAQHAKIWDTLLLFDEQKLPLHGIASDQLISFDYDYAVKAIVSLKTELAKKNGASELFGQERPNALESILGNIVQTFDEKLVYPSTIERAAHLLYFVIKDHPFIDVNKRIGCLLFVLYLKKAQIKLEAINSDGLTNLDLLIAESDPHQKDLMIGLVIRLLTKS